MICTVHSHLNCDATLEEKSEYTSLIYKLPVKTFQLILKVHNSGKLDRQAENKQSKQPTQSLLQPPSNKLELEIRINRFELFNGMHEREGGAPI